MTEDELSGPSSKRWWMEVVVQVQVEAPDPITQTEAFGHVAEAVNGIQDTDGPRKVWSSSMKSTKARPLPALPRTPR